MGDTALLAEEAGGAHWHELDEPHGQRPILGQRGERGELVAVHAAGRDDIELDGAIEFPTMYLVLSNGRHDFLLKAGRRHKLLPPFLLIGGSPNLP